MNKFLLEFPQKIQANRLYLRPYRAGDGPMYYAASLRNREHLAEFESGNVLMHLNDEDHAEIMVRQLAADCVARNCFFLGIFQNNTGEWIGQIFIGPSNWDLPEFMIGYVADVDHEGKGYVTEAVNAALDMLFDAMQAHRITSSCNENNQRSWRLLERCGFKREGHLRDNRKNPDGTYHGDYLYALLRSER